MSRCLKCFITLSFAVLGNFHLAHASTCYAQEGVLGKNLLQTRSLTHRQGRGGLAAVPLGDDAPPPLALSGDGSSAQAVSEAMVAVLQDGQKAVSEAMVAVLQDGQNAKLQGGVEIVVIILALAFLVVMLNVCLLNVERKMEPFGRNRRLRWKWHLASH